MPIHPILPSLQTLSIHPTHRPMSIHPILPTKECSCIHRFLPTIIVQSPHSTYKHCPFTPRTNQCPDTPFYQQTLSIHPILPTNSVHTLLSAHKLSQNNVYTPHSTNEHSHKNVHTPHSTHKTMFIHLILPTNNHKTIFTQPILSTEQCPYSPFYPQNNIHIYPILPTKQWHAYLYPVSDYSTSQQDICL